MPSSRPSLFPSQSKAHARLGDASGGSTFGCNSSVLSQSCLLNSCSAVLGSRIYDYTMKYPPDKPGEEHKENARVWNVYLDEVESHDRDLLQGFRDIIDGVLVFASLFSAVVTTLVAQTSQVLQPDNAQITVSLLVETNQLLRAAGNATAINIVPKSTLSPGIVVHTSKDVWVNGLFFTSLGLSLSTALLTVLVKQWLHAYSSFITGDAQRRAYITNLRSEGLQTWRVREIVEALPLILHGSVLIFFVGLVLYVSQLSTSICAILATITALAFIFYVGTSILPFVFIACPYRILFFFNICESIVYYVRSFQGYFLSNILRAFIPLRLWKFFEGNSYRWGPIPYRGSLDGAELWAIGKTEPHIAFDILERLLQTSHQRSTRKIVIEAVFAFLLEKEEPKECSSSFLSSFQPLGHRIMDRIFRFSLVEFTLLTESTNNGDPLLDDLARTWENRIAFLNEHIEISHAEKISVFFDAFINADRYGSENVCGRILDWIGTPALEDANNESKLQYIMMFCSGNGIRQILERTTVILPGTPNPGIHFIHRYASHGNLDAVKAVVEVDPSLINSLTSSGSTPLEIALLSKRRDVVDYLMDHGGRAEKHSYEYAFFSSISDSDWDMVKLLWRRRREVRIVDTRLDSWCTKSATEVINVKSQWQSMVLEGSKLRKLIEILQECDEANLTSSQVEPAEERVPPLQPHNPLDIPLVSPQPASVPATITFDQHDAPPEFVQTSFHT